MGRGLPPFHCALPLRAAFCSIHRRWLAGGLGWAGIRVGSKTAGNAVAALRRGGIHAAGCVPWPRGGIRAAGSRGWRPATTQRHGHPVAWVPEELRLPPQLGPLPQRLDEGQGWARLLLQQGPQVPQQHRPGPPAQGVPDSDTMGVGGTGLHIGDLGRGDVE